MNEKHASLRENLRALPRGAWILFFGTFLNKFGSFVLPFLTLYLTGLGHSIGEAGVAVGAYGIGSLGACVIGGHLADRLGRRKTIVLSMFSAAVVMLCLSQARNLLAIIGLSCLAGLTAELYRPASSALLADLVPAGQRVTAFAAYRMALNAGFAFGLATAGFLAKSSFLWLFVGNAATSIGYGLFAWFALPQGLRGTRADNSLFDTFRVVRDDKRFRQVLLASLAVGLVFVQIFSTMSLELTQSGFSPAAYGLMISLNGFLIVLSELPITTITKRYAARPVIALGFLLIGAGFASNALARTVPLVIVSVILFTLGEIISMPVAAAYVADLAPVEQRGLYMGTYGFVWALAFVCGPTLGMLLFAKSALALWGTCGLLGLLGAGLVLRERRSPTMLSPPAQAVPGAS